LYQASIIQFFSEIALHLAAPQKKNAYGLFSPSLKHLTKATTSWNATGLHIVIENRFGSFAQNVFYDEHPLPEGHYLLN